MRSFELEEQKQIKDYLDSIDYCGFNRHNKQFDTTAQAVDQKVTYDVLNTTCRCLVHWINNDLSKIFSHSDFLHDDFSKRLYSSKKEEYGAAILSEKTKKEYDKLFWNIFETLAYVKVLDKVNQRPRQFKIRNFEIIKLLAISPDACLCFVSIHAYKLIKSMNLENEWQNYVDDHSRINLINFRSSFDAWIKQNTGHEDDIGQIYQKVINPLFYLFVLPKYQSNKFLRSLGMTQSVADLTYFRIHRRDMRRQRGKTRKEMKEMVQEVNLNPNLDKQKDKVKKWNQQYYGKSGGTYVSEFSGNVVYNGIHIHHIKMQTEFDKNAPVYSNIVENLIIMTPTEHDSDAHLRGNTRIINPANLNLILWKQYSKINSFNERHIGEYQLDPFYKLACYIKNVDPEEYSSEEILRGYIEQIISM